jgi:catechol 2,3-dioxygenase
MFNTETTIHPVFQHLGVTTADADRLIAWYQTVLGMWLVAHTDNPTDDPSGGHGLRVAWLTNDEVNHRMGIIEMPRLTADSERAAHHRLQHIAFAYAGLDELLGTYLRLKALGITPVLCADQGSQTAFYYEDPDRNSVELNILNYDSHWSAIEHMRTSPDFKRQSMGKFIDPDKLVEAREAGESAWSIHKRAWTGAFAPEHPYALDALM